MNTAAVVGMVKIASVLDASKPLLLLAKGGTSITANWHAMGQHRIS